MVAALAGACAKNVDTTQTSSSQTSAAPTDGSQAPTSQSLAKDGGTLTLAAGAPVKDRNPLSVGGDSAGQRSIQGPLYPHPFVTGPDGITKLNEALLVSAEVTKSDPMTVVYKIQPVQAEILQVLKTLQDELGVSYLFVAHDLSVIAEISDQIGVMHGGQMVEQGSANEVIHRSKHPYTKALLAAVPIPDPRRQRAALDIPLPVWPTPDSQPVPCAYEGAH